MFYVLSLVQQQKSAGYMHCHWLSDYFIHLGMTQCISFCCRIWIFLLIVTTYTTICNYLFLKTFFPQTFPKIQSHTSWLLLFFCFNQSDHMKWTQGKAARFFFCFCFYRYVYSGLIWYSEHLKCILKNILWFLFLKGIILSTNFTYTKMNAISWSHYL